MCPNYLNVLLEIANYVFTAPSSPTIMACPLINLGTQTVIILNGSNLLPDSGKLAKLMIAEKEIVANSVTDN